MDENKSGRVIAEEILNEAGFPFSLNHVFTLKDAVSYICKEKGYSDAERPELIILEAGLLYRDMETWSRQVRSDQRFMGIPSAALLLFKEEETYFRSRFLPVDCYIVKPMDLLEMDTTTHALIEFIENISMGRDNQNRTEVKT